MWVGRGVLSSSIRPSQRNHHLSFFERRSSDQRHTVCGLLWNVSMVITQKCHQGGESVDGRTDKNLSTPLLTNELLHLCRVSINRSINTSQRCNGRGEGFADSFPRLTTRLCSTSVSAVPPARSASECGARSDFWQRFSLWRAGRT